MPSTPERQELAYLVLETRKQAAWSRFMQDTIGLGAPVRNSDHSLGWQIDNAAQRLIVKPGPAEDLHALGIGFPDAAALDRRLQRLHLRGEQVREGDSTLCQQRRVQQLHWLQDPAGNRIELVTGLRHAEMPFQSAHFERGFNTTGQGFGHAALVCEDLMAMEAFYVQVLGFGVSERLSTRVGPIAVRGTFLHCNRRHHSLALFMLPLKQRLHHFMLEATEMVAVGLAYERARKTGTRLSLGLGQHPQPDGTFSFYAATPSGFDYEIGWGGQAIEPQTWRTRKATTSSAWGHQPHWPLQLKMAIAWYTRRWFARRSRAGLQPAEES